MVAFAADVAMFRHADRWTALLAMVWLAVLPAQAEPLRVRLIMSQLPPAHSTGYRAISHAAGNVIRQALPLTKCEMWSVPMENVDAVQVAAARLGARVTALEEDWNTLFQPPPANMTMNEKQVALLQRVTGSKATVAASIVAMPAAPLVEFALTANTSSLPSARAAKIKLRLDTHTLLTISRTRIRTRFGRCIWTGKVDGTDAPATLIWWPSGRMAGTVRHKGYIYSIRHIGGGVHAIVQMNESLMPPMHPPSPQRRRADHRIPPTSSATLAARPEFLSRPGAVPLGPGVEVA